MARVPTGIPGFKEALLDATKILTRFETATEQAARRTSRYGEEAGKAGHNLRSAGKDALKAFAFAKALQTGVSVAKGAAGEVAAAAGVSNVVERRIAARERARDRTAAITARIAEVGGQVDPETMRSLLTMEADKAIRASNARQAVTQGSTAIANPEFFNRFLRMKGLEDQTDIAN